MTAPASTIGRVALARHQEKDERGARDDQEDDRSAQRGEIAHRFLEPSRADGIGQVGGVAQRRDDADVEFAWRFARDVGRKAQEGDCAGDDERKGEQRPRVHRRQPGGEPRASLTPPALDSPPSCTRSSCIGAQ